MKSRDLIDSQYGGRPVPPHQNLDTDTELDLASKQGFTAWEYAQRMNRHHPRLLQAVTGTPYEPLYRRHFNLPQQDKWYEGQVKPT